MYIIVYLIKDLIVDVTAQHHKKTSLLGTAELHTGNMADVPCFSLALLAFTSQVLTSLQRSGGMYESQHSRSSRCSAVRHPVAAPVHGMLDMDVDFSFILPTNWL